MDIALVGSKGRVVKSPVTQIIVGGVTVPVFSWKIDGDLHPMALRLIVTELGRIARTGIWME